MSAGATSMQQQQDNVSCQPAAILLAPTPQSDGHSPCTATSTPQPCQLVYDTPSLNHHAGLHAALPLQFQLQPQQQHGQPVCTNKAALCSQHTGASPQLAATASQPSPSALQHPGHGTLPASLTSLATLEATHTTSAPASLLPLDAAPRPLYPTRPCGPRFTSASYRQLLFVSALLLLGCMPRLTLADCPAFTVTQSVRDQCSITLEASCTVRGSCKDCSTPPKFKLSAVDLDSCPALNINVGCDGILFCSFSPPPSPPSPSPPPSPPNPPAPPTPPPSPPPQPPSPPSPPIPPSPPAMPPTPPSPPSPPTPPPSPAPPSPSPPPVPPSPPAPPSPPSPPSPPPSPPSPPSPPPAPPSPPPSPPAPPPSPPSPPTPPSPPPSPVPPPAPPSPPLPPSPPSPPSPPPSPPGPPPSPPSPPAPSPPPSPSPPSPPPSPPSPPSPPLPTPPPTPPAPPPAPPPVAITINVPVGYQSLNVLGVPLLPNPSQLTSVAAAIAIKIVAPATAVTVTVAFEWTTSLYTVTSATNPPACVMCTPQLAMDVAGAQCNRLGIPDCTVVVGACWPVNLPFPTQPPAAATLQPAACTAYVLTSMKLTPPASSANLGVNLFQTSLTLTGYYIPPPGPGAVLVSTSLWVVVRNQGPAPLTFTDVDTQVTTASVLGVPLSSTARLGVPSVGLLPSPPPSPPPPSECKKPHLGNLCGADAIGAIIGIAVGGAILVALFITLLLYVCVRPSCPVVVDDYCWAERYAHVINAQQAAYYTAAVQQKGSPYVVKAMPPPHGYAPSGVLSQ